MKKRIYVMDCGLFVKIGVSVNPDRRKDQIPYKVFQYYCSPKLENPFEIEKKLHSYFSYANCRQAYGREYFHVSFETAIKKVMEFSNAKEIEVEKKVLKSKMDISTEKVVICKLKEAIPKMNDFQKGYMLGMVESMAGKKEKESEKERS